MVLAPAQHRPLVGLALAVALGTLLGLSFPLSVWPHVSAAALCVALALSRKRNRGTGLLLAAFFYAAGNGAFSATRDRLRSEALLALQESRTQVQLTGTILTEPDGRPLPHGGARLSFRLRVLAATDADGAPLPLPRHLLPMPLDVDFYAPESYLGENPTRQVPLAGEGWTFSGRIRARDVPFQEAPLLSLRTSVDDPHARVSSADASPWRQTLWGLRRETARRLALGIGEKRRDVAILRAVLLGYRSDVPDDVRDLFANSGTVHFFAISGLHILLIAGLFRGVLNRIGLPHRTQGLLLIPALIAYTVLTGGRPSAARACIMTSLYCAGTVFQRRPDALSSVAAAAVAILAMDPMQLGDLGFVFSFASVLGILLLTPSLKVMFETPFRRSEDTPEDEAETLIARMEAARPTVSESGQRPSFAVQCLSDAAIWCMGLPRRAAMAMAVSIAAWAVAEPITAHVFGQMVPVSMFSNVVVIPLGSLTVASAVLGLVAGCIAPMLEAPFNMLSAALVDAMVGTTGFFARLPFGHFETEPWPMAAVAVWYACVLFMALVLHVAMGRFRKK